MGQVNVGAAIGAIGTIAQYFSRYWGKSIVSQYFLAPCIFNECKYVSKM